MNHRDDGCSPTWTSTAWAVVATNLPGLVSTRHLVRTITLLLIGLSALVAIHPLTAGAQSRRLGPVAEQGGGQRREDLTLTAEPGRWRRETSGTALFVDDVGHMLTARHAVDDCIREGLFRPVRADVAAQTLWMSVHGLVSLLVMQKPFPFAPAAVLAEAQ